MWLAVAPLPEALTWVRRQGLILQPGSAWTFHPPAAWLDMMTVVANFWKLNHEAVGDSNLPWSSPASSQKLISTVGRGFKYSQEVFRKLHGFLITLSSQKPKELNRFGNASGPVSFTGRRKLTPYVHVSNTLILLIRFYRDSNKLKHKSHFWLPPSTLLKTSKHTSALMNFMRM